MKEIKLLSSSPFNQFSHLLSRINGAVVLEDRCHVYVPDKKDKACKEFRFMNYFTLQKAHLKATQEELKRIREMWNGQSNHTIYKEDEIQAIANQDLLIQIDRKVYERLWNTKNLIRSRMTNGNHANCRGAYTCILEYDLKALDDPKERRIDRVTIGFNSFSIPEF